MKTRTRSTTATVQPKADRKTGKTEEASPAQRSESFYLCLAIAGLIVAVAACYANSLWNGFVFDDPDLVLSNPLLRSLHNVPRLLVTSYRSMRDISYALDFAIWGPGPFGFHLTNVLIHVANTVVVFLLLRRLTGGLTASLIGAFFFALHPLQTDAVTYVSGRRDVLSAFFYLLSFWSYLSFREANSRPDKKKWIYLALFLFLWVLSLLAKEMAASLPLVLFLWNVCDLWGGQSGSRVRRAGSALWKAAVRDRWLYLSGAAGGIAYTIYMAFILGGSGRASVRGLDYWGGSVYTNFLTVLRVHAWYLKQIVFPTPIAQYSGGFDISRTAMDWRVLIAFLAVGAVIAAGLALLGRSRLAAFGILAYFAMLLPVSHIIPHHELLADHYLYQPLVGIALLVALAVKALSSRGLQVRRAVYVTAGAVLITFAVLTVLRNLDWKDEFTVWKVNYESVPTSPRAAYNLGLQYMSRNPRKSEDLFKQTLKLDNTFTGAYALLGRLYLGQNRLDEAEQLVEKGLSLTDAQMKTLTNSEPRMLRSQLITLKAVATGKRGQVEKAEALMKEAIQVYPPNPEPYMMLAAVYHNTDRNKEIQILKDSLVGNPNTLEVYRKLVYLLIEQNRQDEAKDYLSTLLARVPNDFFGNYHMGLILMSTNDCSGAREYLQKARAGASAPEENSSLSEAEQRLKVRCQ